MKILLTGGTGYIGSHTALELLKSKEHYEVILLDNLANSKATVVDTLEQLTGRRPVFYRADLLDAEKTQDIFTTERPDAVIHFAGLKAVAESVEKPLLYYRTNLLATLNLLSSMESAGVKNLIFSSSATVYGSCPVPPSGLTEDSQTGIGITNPYGETKFMIERIIRDFTSTDNNFSATILRYFNPVGCDPSGLLGEDPNGRPNNLMPIVGKVYTGEIPELKIFGDDYETKDGTCERDFIHVSDLAKGHLAALAQMFSARSSVSSQAPTSNSTVLPSTSGNPDQNVKTYNLGTGRPSSVQEIISAFESACHKELKKSFAPRRPGDLPVLFANVEKAERELGWRAEKNLTDIATDLVRFLDGNV